MQSVNNLINNFIQINSQVSLAKFETITVYKTGM